MTEFKELLFQLPEQFGGLGGRGHGLVGATAGGFFESMGDVILWGLIYLERFFVWPPWPVVILGVAFCPGP